MGFDHEFPVRVIGNKLTGAAEALINSNDLLRVDTIQDNNENSIS